MTSILQSLAFPDERTVQSFALFLRSEDFAVPIRSGPDGVEILSGQTLDFATFYNAFSLRKWQDIADFARLTLSLSGRGRVRCRLYGHTRHLIRVPLREVEIDLAARDAIELPALDEMPFTMLSFSLESLSETCLLRGGAWRIEEAPRRSVSLDVVITTFNRERIIGETVRKFRDEILPLFPAGKLHLSVIDNGRSLEPLTAPGVEILHNPNLGGAGGFTRGILETRGSGRGATHVLFMDDDAACNIESLQRTVAILEHARDERTAVAGAMLSSSRPNLQFEKSARFFTDLTGPEWTWEALGRDVDLSLSDNVVLNDAFRDGNYGAWWFFAFPLAQMQQLPFPFFVRGDDTDFSLSNDFHIITMNGIASICDDLRDKESPVVEYLAQRSWLALCLMHGDEKRFLRQVRRLRRRALACGNAFDFAMMTAGIWALEDVLKGPAEFARNPAPLERLAALRALPRGRQITVDELARLAPIPSDGGLIGRTLRLLARPFARTRHTNRRLGLLANLNDAYKKKTSGFGAIALRNGGGTTLVFEKDEARFETLHRHLHSRIAEARASTGALRADYASHAPQYRTEGFWRELLKL